MNYTITREKGGVIAWTEEQVAYIIDKYLNEDYSLKQLGKEFNCSYGTVRNLLHKKNIKTRGNKQGYPRNEYYFYSIDTREKAYWLGFLYADGSTSSKNYCVSITLTDEEHLFKFKTAIGAINHTIGSYEDERFPNAKRLYTFSIKDKQLWSDLVKWGCVPNKSLILKKIPNIPRDFIPDFIRGYFDGDGSLNYSKATKFYRINFSSGSKDFLLDIKKEVGAEHISLQKHKEREVYSFQIMGRKQVLRVLDYLYNTSEENTRLDRKYNLYLKVLKEARSPLNQ